MKLPMSLEEVTPAWLTFALSVRWPGITVSSVNYDTVSHGAATRARLSFDFDWQGDGDPPPSTMWLKTGFEAHHDFCMAVYTAEVDFYSNIRQHLSIRTPECYFAMVQTDPPQATILLEDLTKRNVVFNTPTHPLTVDQAVTGLEQLAQLHSQSLAESNLASMLKPISITVRDATTERSTESEQYFKWPRAYAAPVVLLDADRLRAGFEVYWKMDAANEQCLVHGDTHVRNTYTDPDDTVCFLDWQGYGTGYWMQDIPYFIIGALDLPDRRANEQDLFKHYLSRREALGNKMPAFNEVWDDYRRAVYFGFITWLGNEDDWQPPEVNMAQYARFAAAMIDHDTFGAMGI